jgi:hypothetical protein
VRHRGGAEKTKEFHHRGHRVHGAERREAKRREAKRREEKRREEKRREEKRREEKRRERPAIWETIAATGIFNLAFEAEERGEKITRRRGGTRRNGSRYGIDRAVRRGKTPAGCPSFLRASRRYRRSGAG